MQVHFCRFTTIAICLAGSATFTLANPGASESSGTRHLDMRYEPGAGNFAGGSAAVTGGPLDDYKNVQLDDNWTMSLGGEIRYRFESETDKFLAAPGSQDSFHLFRYLINADFKYQDSFRIYVELIGAFDEDRRLARRATDENHWDIEQLFIETNMDLFDRSWNVRVGRQFLSYGSERFVSPGEWDNVRQRFDGVRMATSDDTWDFDMWWARPVVSQRKQHDRLNEDIEFWGAYATYKGMENRALDVYFFALLDEGMSVNPNGSVGSGGDRNIYTLGTRYWGTSGAWDYEAELAGQWGHWSGDTVRAWSFSFDTGYTLETECETRLGFGFDVATGDRNPGDGTVERFTQLFPDTHRYFGYLDLIGRQNITSANVNVSAWAVKDVARATVAFHGFWLTNEKDALSGGGVFARDTFGDSGREIGYELDAALTWKIDDASDMLFGWSHLWDNEFLQSTTPGENADLFYVQYVYRF